MEAYENTNKALNQPPLVTPFWPQESSAQEIQSPELHLRLTGELQVELSPSLPNTARVPLTQAPLSAELPSSALSSDGHSPATAQKATVVVVVVVVGGHVNTACPKIQAAGPSPCLYSI